MACRLPLLLALLLVGCSISEPLGEASSDPLSAKLRQATEEVPLFGGFAFEGDALVVFTLGPAAPAESVVRAIFANDPGVVVRERPAQGNASARTLRAVRDAAPKGTLYSLTLPSSPGYVEVGVPDAGAVQALVSALGARGVPLSEVIIGVVPPPELRAR